MPRLTWNPCKYNICKNVTDGHMIDLKIVISLYFNRKKTLCACLLYFTFRNIKGNPFDNNALFKEDDIDANLYSMKQL